LSDIDRQPRSRRPQGLIDAERVDHAVYVAIAGTPTPALDRPMGRLSRAADYSRLSLVSAAALAIAGGPGGRRAASTGLASLGVTVVAVNAAVKPFWGRRRPDRAASAAPTARHVPMPASGSFPSGHSAAAFAFAAGVGDTAPSAAAALRALAAVVAYSRVHTGVHYPGDVVAGALIGTSLAQLTTQALAHRRLAR
jgi:membrane-associated phospholipid phosphatase